MLTDVHHRLCRAMANRIPRLERGHTARKHLKPATRRVYADVSPNSTDARIDRVLLKAVRRLPLPDDESYPIVRQARDRFSDLHLAVLARQIFALKRAARHPKWIRGLGIGAVFELISTAYAGTGMTLAIVWKRDLPSYKNCLELETIVAGAENPQLAKLHAHAGSKGKKQRERTLSRAGEDVAKILPDCSLVLVSGVQRKLLETSRYYVRFSVSLEEKVGGVDSPKCDDTGINAQEWANFRFNEALKKIYRHEDGMPVVPGDLELLRATMLRGIYDSLKHIPGIQRPPGKRSFETIRAKSQKLLKKGAVSPLALHQK